MQEPQTKYLHQQAQSAVDGRANDALDKVLTLLEHTIRTSDKKNFVDAELLLQNQNIQANDDSTAVPHLLRLRQLCSQHNEHWMAANLCRRLAWIYDIAGEDDDAIALLREAESLFKSHGDGIGQARCANNIGVMWTRRLMLPEAETAFKSALELAAAANSDEEHARVLVNYGHACERMGPQHYETGVAYLLEAIRISRALNQPYMEIAALINIARLFALMGQTEKAHERLEGIRQIAIDKVIQVSATMLQEMDLIRAWMALTQANPAKAIQLLEQALVLTRTHHLPREEHTIVLELTKVYALEKQFEAAYTMSQTLLTLERATRAEKASLSVAIRDAKQEAIEAQARAEVLREHMAQIDAARLALERANQEKTALLAILERQSLEDALTGLPNRRALELSLHTLKDAHSQARHSAICVGILDIDFFKKVNDDYSHAVGDQVLRLVANCLREYLRVGDFVARFGGEEFVILLPNTSAVTGREVAERLRLAVAGMDVSSTSLPYVPTISLGLTQVREAETWEDALSRADAALYESKRGGRNRLTMA